MSLTGTAKKLARSACWQVPGVYAALASHRRYLAYRRLGLVHEPEFRFLPRLVDTVRPLVVDAGANVGQSVASVYAVLPEARVIGFEPDPLTWPHLDRLVTRFPSFRYVGCGLAARTGAADLHVPVYRGRVMTGLASLDPEQAVGWFSSDAIFGFRPDQLEVRRRSVALRRLDDFALAPDVVKIDVQGWEDAVVAGGWSTIRAHTPILLVETPSGALEERLASVGYRMLEVVGGHLTASRRRATNQLFVPEADPTGAADLRWSGDPT